MANATPTSSATTTSSVKSTTASVLGNAIAGFAKGLGVSDGGIGQTVASTFNHPRAYEAEKNSSMSMPSTLRMLVQEQVKIPAPEEAEEAVRDLQNDQKLPEDNDINSAYNRLHEKVEKGFIAVTDVIQHNFHLVEQRLNEQSHAINILSTEQVRQKRTIDDLEQRFGRFERGGLQSRNGGNSPFSSYGTQDNRNAGARQSGPSGIDLLEGIAEASLLRWVGGKLLPILKRIGPWAIAGAAAVYTDQKRQDLYANTPHMSWGDKLDSLGYGTSPSVQEYNRKRDTWRNNRSSLQSHQRPDALGLSGSGSSNIDDRRGQAPYMGSGRGTSNPQYFTGGQPNEKGPITLNAQEAIISADRTATIKGTDVDIKGKTLTINADKVELSPQAKKSLIEALGLDRLLSGVRSVGGAVTGGLSSVVSGLSGTNIGGGADKDYGQHVIDHLVNQSGFGKPAPNRAIGGGFGVGRGGFGGQDVQAPAGSFGYGGQGQGGGYGISPRGSGGGGNHAIGGRSGVGSGRSFGGGDGGGPPSTPMGKYDPTQSRPSFNNQGGVIPGSDKVGGPQAMYNPVSGTSLGGGVGGTSASMGAGRHQGDDIMAPYGSPVYAVKGGTIERIGTDNFGTPAVTIRHADGTTARYLHLSSVDMKVGQQVEAGGVFGKSGRANGADHLHFEMWSGTPNKSQIMNPRGTLGYSGKNLPVGGQLATNSPRESDPNAPPRGTKGDRGGSGGGYSASGQNISSSVVKGGQDAAAIKNPEAPGYAGPPVNPTQQAPKGSNNLANGPGLEFDSNNMKSLSESRKQQFAQELQNPKVREAIMRRMESETGGQSSQRTQMWVETLMNRAESRGWSLAHAASDESRYYPKNSHGKTPSNPELYNQIIDRVAGGSNMTKYATGNASDDVGFGYGSAQYVPGRGMVAPGQTVDASDLGPGRSRKSPLERYGHEQLDEKWVKARLEADRRQQGETQTPQDPSKNYPHGQSTPITPGQMPRANQPRPQGPPQQQTPQNPTQQTQGGQSRLTTGPDSYGNAFRIPSGKFPGGNVRQVQYNAAQQASKYLPKGYSVVAYSGQRDGADQGPHRMAGAIDFRIVGPDGKEIGNYQNPQNYRIYQAFHQDVHKILYDQSPQLADQHRWGGYFGGRLGKNPATGKDYVYGAMDLMHGDFNIKNGMAAGSWDKGYAGNQPWGNLDTTGGMGNVKTYQLGSGYGDKFGPVGDGTPSPAPSTAPAQGGTEPLPTATPATPATPTPYAEGWEKNSIAKKGWDPEPSPMPDWYTNQAKDTAKDYNIRRSAKRDGLVPAQGGPVDTGPSTPGKYSGASGEGQKADPEILNQGNKYSGANKFGAKPPARDIPVPSEKTLSGPITTEKNAAPADWHKVDSTKHPDVQQKWADVDKGAAEGKSGANKVVPSNPHLKNRAHAGEQHKAAQAKQTSGGHKQSTDKGTHGGGGKSGGHSKGGGQGIQGAPQNHPESAGPSPGSDGIGMEKVNADYGRGGLCMV